MPTTFANSIDSNPIYAARAENDKDGNRIDTTYAKLADIPSGTQLVPAATSSDANKVLTVDAQGVPGWAAGGGGSTYTAGEGIDITSDVISVDHDSTLTTLSSTSQLTPTLTGSETVSTPSVGDATIMTQFKLHLSGATNNSTLSISITPETVQGGAALPLYGLQSAGGTLRLHILPIQFLQQHIMGASDLATVSVASSPAKQWFGYPYEATTPISVTGTIASLFDWTNGATIADYIDGSGDVTIGLSYRYNGSWEELNVKAMITGDTTTTGQVAFATVRATVETISNQIAVTNPLPASTSSDANKVLKVNAQGAPAWAAAQSVTVDQTYNAASTNAQSGTAVAGALATIDEVPAVTSSDDGKVLKAAYSGGAGSYAWEAEPTMLGIVAGANVTVTEGASDITIAATDTTYTSGNMIAIDANNSNAIGVSTTAGITDIQLVNALPANPVSTVLYLIPET